VGTGRYGWGWLNTAENSFFHTDFSLSNSLKFDRKSVLIMKLL
jgi:uncharacterized protein (DUF2132 family)